MTKCAAYKCNNRGMHRFPKDPTRRKLWEQALGRKQWKCTPSSRLCPEHFKPSDYFGRSIYTDTEPVSRFLRKNAVPTIFSKKPESEEKQQRKKRNGERCVKKELVLNPEEPSMSVQIIRMDVKSMARELVLLSESDQIDTSTSKKNECSVSVSRSTQVNIEFMYGSILQFKDDPNGILYYTGFESYEKFNLVFSTLTPFNHKMQYFQGNIINLSTENQFFLTMMKLRHNKDNFELARFFKVSLGTVSDIFIMWINYIDQLWSMLNIWPDKTLIESHMPKTFKKNHKNHRVDDVDGTEIPIQKPNSASKDVTVKVPAFIKGKFQMSGKKLANNIEHLVGLTNVYKILKDLDYNYVHIASKIFFVCFMCCYFKEGIIETIN